MILSEEKMKIARQAKNVSELLQLAKENGQWIPEYDIEGGYEIILNNGDLW